MTEKGSLSSRRGKCTSARALVCVPRVHNLLVCDRSDLAIGAAAGMTDCTKWKSSTQPREEPSLGALYTLYIHVRMCAPVRSGAASIRVPTRVSPPRCLVTRTFGADATLTNTLPFSPAHGSGSDLSSAERDSARVVVGGFGRLQRTGSSPSPCGRRTDVTPSRYSMRRVVYQQHAPNFRC